MRKYRCAGHVFSMVRYTVNPSNVLLGRTLYFSASACIWQIKHSNDFNVCAALCKSTEQISKRQNRLSQATSPPELSALPKGPKQFEQQQRNVPENEFEQCQR